MIKTLLIVLLPLFISCNTSKNMDKTEASKMSDTTTENMENNGFTAGTIVYSAKEGDCDYTILTNDGKSYESTDLADEFKKDALKVWFKYQPLRRMNRCNNANPVGISEMKLQ